MVSNRQKLSLVAVIVSCLLAFALGTTTFSYGRVYGGLAELPAILQQLHSSFERAGFDLGGSPKVPLNGTRPRLELLSNFEGAAPPNFESQDWIEDFNRGRVGAVGAVPNSGDQTSTDQKALEAKWNMKPGIFISFARKDVEAANKAATIFERSGHSVFRYLNDKDGPPKYSAEFTGKMFSRAEQYFVVDTPNARHSSGVWVEAITLKDIVNGQIRDEGETRAARDEAERKGRPPGNDALDRSKSFQGKGGAR